MTYHHRILVDPAARGDAERRLREHGFEPRERKDYDPVYVVLDFYAPEDADLGFLRPAILPPA